MDKNEFVKNFASQFDDTPEDNVQIETDFRTLDEWSSMIALSVIAMVDEKYNVRITGDDIRSAKTINDLFEIVSKKTAS